MKYILLIYHNPATLAAFSEEELSEVMGTVDALMKEMTESGEWIGGEGLADASQARTVRVRGGVPAITDGPFVEAKEQLAGYLPVRVRDPGARDRDRRALARRQLRRGRAAAADGSVRNGDVTTDAARVEDLLRGLAPQVLGALVRRYRRFDAAEDAVQEALLAAAVHWPGDGVPENPRGVADHGRLAPADRRAAQRAVAPAARGHGRGPGPAARGVRAGAGRRAAGRGATTPWSCCSSAATPRSRRRRRSRSRCARSAVSRRPRSRARSSSPRRRWLSASAGPSSGSSPPARRSGCRRRSAPSGSTRCCRCSTSSSTRATPRRRGRHLHRTELTREAIRLTRAVHGLLPDDGEVAGLLALMLLTDARRPARTRPDGTLVPLAEQDRTLWNAR